MLSAAVQTGSLELLTGCIKHWTCEGNAACIVFLLCLLGLEVVASCLFLFSVFKEQPSSAVNLRFVLEWTWNKVICTKDELDQICEYWCSHV